MKTILKNLLRDTREMLSKRYFKVMAFLSFVFLALCIFLPAWQLLPEIKDKFAIPLHYNIHFGIDSFGEWWRVFMIPVYGAIAIFANFILAVLLWSKEKVLSHFLVAVALLIQVFLLISMIFVVLFNLAYG